MATLPAFLRRLTKRGKHSAGDTGERLARLHLQAQGYKTLAKNLRSRHGEIDLLMIAPNGRTIVFVEVKTARPDRQSTIPPELRVGKQKQKKIAQLAARLIAKRKLTNRPVRFDVVGVTLYENKDASIRHYPHAFESPW